MPEKLVEVEPLLGVLLLLLLLPQLLMMETIPAMTRPDITEAKTRDAFIFFLQISRLISEYILSCQSKYELGRIVLSQREVPEGITN